ncbi:heterokaryon incompatibility, partial [Phaeosphaeriaceae sp. PMI808]
MQGVGALDKPSACSQTIRDAMLIYRRTGVRYLWVDALCILQDSPPEELSKQINNMDSVYTNAHFTIVAADS